jgi:hypothetical protein
MKHPVIIFCVTGRAHLIMCIWSVRSLKRWGYTKIEIVVATDLEKQFIHEHLGDVTCEVVVAELKGYRMWAWRPFVLEKYQVKHENCAIVICDADILWRQDPALLFDRFRGQAWIHKITSLDPGEFEEFEFLSAVPKRRIGLRTMLAYRDQYGLDCYPNFHLNCGLFMLDNDTFPVVLQEWVRVIRAVPPEQMIMTEALLSLVYAKLGIEPVSDEADIKHHGIAQREVKLRVVQYRAVSVGPEVATGYQTAKHYFSNQRKELLVDARKMGVDEEKFSRELKIAAMRKSFGRVVNLPERIRARMSGRGRVG